MVNDVLVVDKEVVVVEVIGLVVVYERVVVADLVGVVVMDLSVEGVDEDYLMNDLVRFGTYHRPDLDCRS